MDGAVCHPASALPQSDSSCAGRIGVVRSRQEEGIAAASPDALPLASVLCLIRASDQPQTARVAPNGRNNVARTAAHLCQCFHQPQDFV